MLVAMGISALVLTGVATFISMAATSLSGTASQTFINYRTSSAGEFIFRRIRLATKVDNGGDTNGTTLRVGIDENPAVDSNTNSIPYDDQDHWEIFQFQNFSSTNGAKVVADNRLSYQPDGSKPQTVVLIASGIRALPGKLIFALTNGATVLVNFAVVDNYSRDGYQTCDIQGAITSRNRAFSTNSIANIP